MNIYEARRNFKKMVRDTEKITIEEIKKESTFIGDLNREQLLDGQKSDGSDMPPYRSRGRRGNIKLKDTGAYHRGIAPKFQGRAIVMDSSDYKKTLLGKRYPLNLGLTNRSVGTLIVEILPNIQNRLRNI